MAEGTGRTALASAEPVAEPWELPSGWRWCRLLDVSDAPERGEPRSKFAKTFNYLDVGGLDKGKVTPRVVLSEAAPSRARQFLQTNDTVISGVRVYLRNFALIESDGGDVASTAFCVLRPRPDIDPKYLFYWVASDQFIYGLLPLQRGNSPPAVLDADIRRQLIPVPPLDMQARTVRRIEELFAEIAEGESALGDARTGLGIYRRSLLNAAVTGKLSADWRSSNQALESAQQFLERLRAEVISERPVSSKQVVGPFPVPKEWVWTTLGAFVTRIDAGLNIKAEGRPPQDNELGVVKVSAVTWDEYDEQESKTLPSGAEPRKNTIIKPGDFLISRANTLELVGAPAMVRQTVRRLYLSDKILRLIISNQLKEWIYFVLKSPLGRQEIQERATGNQLGMRNITQDAIRSLPIPLPPERELAYLTGAVRNAWDTHKVMLDGYSLEDGAASLRQSILAAAFRGELVQ